jgi:tRNA A37 methylthiotransferase MiaB
MLKEVEYEMAFMFAYSMRERTHAWHKVGKGVWEDDVTEPMKKRRLKTLNSVSKIFRLLNFNLDEKTARDGTL